MKQLFIFLLTLFFLTSAKAQTENSSDKGIAIKKNVSAKRIGSPISIDGKLDESEWQNAETAKEFVMLRPENGTPLDMSKDTEVKVLYDNEAIYIGAMMKDDPKLIMKEITQRDDDGTADFFGLSINGYNDGQQEFRFFVTAAGVQLDANANSQTGEDFSWDAIWNSNVFITSDGWNVEIKLPYSALRFPKEEKQTWGIQFFRQIRRDRQLYTWNFVDNNKGSLEQQSGILNGIEKISPPTRLFLFPYASAYLSNNKEDGTNTEFKGGLDIKYGINDAFTLDAILIPDFGQTAFDNQILNLGPFEQQFNENRPFFTEGTDLFNKGNLFYSRRIGGKPSLRSGKLKEEININEVIDTYPDKINLLNALKVSGRTNKGLGIGILNAITEKTEAIVRDTITKSIRKEVIEPLTNYNIISLDQRFSKNSSVSFVNTNVYRNGHFRDANVSALLFDLNNKKNTWNLGGDFKYSAINEYKNLNDRNGINTTFYLRETAGKYRYGINANYVSKKFDNNDLGINFMTNFTGIYANFNYRILKPTDIFNSLSYNINVNQQYENTTGKLQGGNINFNLNTTFLNNDSFGGGIFLRPVKIYDFYMPQTKDKFVQIPEYYETWFYYSSNYNNKFALDINPWIGTTSTLGRNSFGYNISPRYRFSNKLLVILSYDYFKENNAIGLFDNNDSNNIIFEKRNINTSTISLRSKYAINNTMTINLNTRYYWSYVNSKGFQVLGDNGKLGYTSFTSISDQDFSSWNLDCSYSWWISPGSQLNLLYRNNSSNYAGELQRVDKDLNRNFSNLFGDKLNHTFSISLRYFLDYNQIKSWL